MLFGRTGFRADNHCVTAFAVFNQVRAFGSRGCLPKQGNAKNGREFDAHRTVGNPFLPPRPTSTLGCVWPLLSADHYVSSRRIYRHLGNAMAFLRHLATRGLAGRRVVCQATIAFHSAPVSRSITIVLSVQDSIRRCGMFGTIVPYRSASRRRLKGAKPFIGAVKRVSRIGSGSPMGRPRKSRG